MVLPLVLAALTLSGRVQVWHVFVLATCLGVVNAFDIPARQAFVVEMVGREDLLNAIALNSSMVNGARIVGPAIAGMLVAAVGEGWCFLLNGVSYIAVIAGLLLMRVPAAAAPAARASALRDTRRGLPVRRADGAGPRAAPAARARQLRRHAVRRADADLRRIDPARRAAGLGLLMAASGLGALGGARRAGDATTASAASGAGSAIATGGFGVALIAVLVLAQLLAVGGAARAGRLLR